MTEAKLAQYKILWDTIESELKRFWQGFHILSVMKVALLSTSLTFLNGDDDEQRLTLLQNLVENKHIWLTLLFGTIVLAIINVLLNLRAQSVYLALTSAVREFEKEDSTLNLAEMIIKSSPIFKEQSIPQGSECTETPENLKIPPKYRVKAFPYAMAVANVLPILIINISLIITYLIIFNIKP